MTQQLSMWLLRIISLILLVFPAAIFAKISPQLMIAPHTFELDVFPGERIEEKIKILNQGSIPLPVSTRLVDFDAEEETGEMFFDESISDISISSKRWIKIQNPHFILDPGETQETVFTIEVPENAEPGGHYSVLFFEPALPSFYFKEGQPRAIPQLGVLFLFSVKTLSLEPVNEDKIEISKLSISEKDRIGVIERLFGVRADAILKDKDFNFFVKFQNNDIYHHKIGGTLTVFNFFGRKIGQAEIKKTTILPRKSREIEVKFSPEVPNWLPFSDFFVKNTGIGRYKAVLDLEEKKQGISLKDEVSFWFFPLKLVLIIIILFSLFFILRKRLRLAFKVLFNK